MKKNIVKIKSFDVEEIQSINDYLKNGWVYLDTVHRKSGNDEWATVLLGWDQTKGSVPKE